MKKILLLSLAVLLLVMSCASYTARDAITRIPPSSSTDGDHLSPTRLADIPPGSVAIPMQKDDDAPPPAVPAVSSEDQKAASPEVIPELEPAPVKSNLPVVLDFSVPDLSKVTLPYHHKTGAAPRTITSGLTHFSLLFIPLPSGLSSEEIATLVPSVVGSIADLGVDIIVLSGPAEASALFTEQAKRSAVIAAEGAVITDFPIKAMTDHGVTITLAPEKDVELRWKTLGDSGVLRSIAAGSTTWQQTVADGSARRLGQVEEVVADVDAAAPVVFALSAHEPSHVDWTILSPRSWRKDMAWPLSTALTGNGWIDAYAVTHYSGETNAGATWSLGTSKPVEERTDFLYVKNLMSIETSVLHLGVLSVPSADKPARMGVLGTFLVP